MSQRETCSSKRKTRSQSVAAAPTPPPRKVPRKPNTKKKQKPRKQTISPPSSAQATLPSSSSNRDASKANAKKKQKPRKQTVSPPSSAQAASNRDASKSNAKKKQRSKKQAISPPPSVPITIMVYPPSSPSSRDASKLKANCLLDYHGVQDAKVVQSHQGQLLKTSFPVDNKTFELAVVQVHDEFYFFTTMHRTNGFPEFSLDGPCTLLEAEDAFIKMLLRKANTEWPPSSPSAVASSASRSHQATRQLRQGFFVPQPTGPPHILNGRAVEFRMD
ncbi:unnamed protein product [Aphanomyces euteiches]|uniref:Uncharacterized protein n=1 Tax=Aphanomyces euteiches TaxID=100861 RepID=A0A6G0XJ04_9STRA|nr:hypothetical protein Ae201684_004269 [Aphanomyces euteiches]KAH9094083.1 hypothetical protein Ae201684P_016699 [Aphanomyces euteiches]KAH9136368.1 hypothetical protein AeRB84_018440 [Aphanomyces euteiches]